MTAGAYAFVLDAQDWAYQEALRKVVVKENEIWKRNFEKFTTNIVQPFASIGVLVSVVLSFNSVNKERRDGSFRVLLSYPVRKSAVILGKLLGGAAVVLIVGVASMMVSFAVVVYGLGIIVDTEFILRVTSVTGLGVLLLLFYLCIGTALSTMIRDSSVALIGMILFATLFRLESFAMLMVGLSGVAYLVGFKFNIPENLRYGTFSNVYFDTVLRNYWVISPFEAFIGYSNEIFRFGNFFATEPTYLPIEFEYLLVYNMDLVWSIIIYTVAAFAVCYLVVLKRDIS